MFQMIFMSLIEKMLASLTQNMKRKTTSFMQCPNKIFFKDITYRSIDLIFNSDVPEFLF